MDGARGVLLSVAGGSDLGLFEINEAASLVQEAAHPDANIIFGTVIDDSLGDEVRVTVIAAGFDSGAPTHKKLDPAAFRASRGSDGATSASSSGPVSNGVQQSPVRRGDSSQSNYNQGPTIPPQLSASVQPSSSAARTVLELDEDEVDVPPFMRR